MKVTSKTLTLDIISIFPGLNFVIGGSCAIYDIYKIATSFFKTLNEYKEHKKQELQSEIQALEKGYSFNAVDFVDIHELKRKESYKSLFKNVARLVPVLGGIGLTAYDWKAMQAPEKEKPLPKHVILYPNGNPPGDFTSRYNGYLDRLEQAGYRLHEDQKHID